MRKSLLVAVMVVLLIAVFVTPAFAKGGRAGDTLTIYVTSQGLYYDTFVSADKLPMKGPFMQLYDDHSTMYGPGVPGYVGGRWWVDVNHNDMMDEGDAFFLCPLLGPGRMTP